MPLTFFPPPCTIIDWGKISGDIADQEDLQNALDGKAASCHDHDADYSPLSHSSDTDNPHEVTKSQVGLGNVTNDAQVKKSASSTDGNIPLWDGASGNLLKNGPGLQTLISESDNHVPTSAAVSKYACAADDWSRPYGGYIFDGTDDYIDFANSCDFGTGDFSIEVWLKFNAGGSLERIASKYENSNYFWTINKISNDRIQFTGRAGGENKVEAIGSTSLSAGVLYHIIVRVDRNAGCSIYINNFEESLGTNTYSTDDIDNNGDMHIGRLSSNYFDGEIYLMRIYSDLLIESEIQQAFNNGRPDQTPKFDNCMLELIPQNAGAFTWRNNVNQNHGRVDGAAALTKIPNPLVLKKSISGDTVLTNAVPAGYKIDMILVDETAGNAVSGGLNIGTGAGGSQVVSAAAVAANAQNVDCTLAKRYFSDSASQSLYLNAATAWNSASIDIKILLKRLL